MTSVWRICLWPSPSRKYGSLYIPHPGSRPQGIFGAKRPRNSSTSSTRYVHSCLTVVLEELSTRCRRLHCQNWTENFGNNVSTCFTRSAKAVNCCQPRIFCSKSLCMSAKFIVLVGSRTLAKGSIWDVAWLSNTSGSGLRTRPTRFSRYFSYSSPNSSSSFSLHAAVLPGNYRLEAPIPSKHLASFGSFYLHRSPEFPYRL